MPFDALHDWCVGLERDLDPVARVDGAEEQQPAVARAVAAPDIGVEFVQRDLRQELFIDHLFQVLAPDDRLVKGNGVKSVTQLSLHPAAVILEA